MARYRRSRGREFAVAAVLLLLALVRWLGGWPSTDETTRGTTATGLSPGVYRVERVVDGDTLVLHGGRLRLRLQGVDTPETVKEDSPVEPWGPEASLFTKRFIRESNGEVRIEIDGEPRDQHGRFLAFVWRGERLLNAELVRNGLARATLQYDFSERKKEVLRKAQREAKRAGVGIWSSDH
jgi:micrococcal nuclease